MGISALYNRTIKSVLEVVLYCFTSLEVRQIESYHKSQVMKTINWLFEFISSDADAMQKMLRDTQFSGYNFPTEKLWQQKICCQTYNSIISLGF